MDAETGSYSTSDAVYDFGIFDYQRNSGFGQSAYGTAGNAVYTQYRDASNYSVGAFAAGTAFPSLTLAQGYVVALHAGGAGLASLDSYWWNLGMQGVSYLKGPP